MTRPLHIVDVFAEHPYAGNPLAVVLEADGLSDNARGDLCARADRRRARAHGGGHRDHGPGPGALGRHLGDDRPTARFFFEARGVREDPATGNGAAFLGAWLLEHRYLPGSDLSLRIEQGDEVHRPSLVRLKARLAGTREVHVGGSVIPVVRGEMI